MFISYETLTYPHKTSAAKTTKKKAICFTNIFIHCSKVVYTVINTL